MFHIIKFEFEVRFPGGRTTLTTAFEFLELQAVLIGGDRHIQLGVRLVLESNISHRLLTSEAEGVRFGTDWQIEFVRQSARVRGSAVFWIEKPV